jgi:hypothetical protein
LPWSSFRQAGQYLEERDVDFGIYVVLWFKGRRYSQPSDSSLDACIERLKEELPGRVVDVVGFDVSFKESASTRNKAKQQRKKKKGRKKQTKTPR